MLAYKDDLLRFHRARWILIGVTAIFIYVYSTLFVISAGIIWNFVVMLGYLLWMFYWVFTKYRCPKCNYILRMRGFNAVDLAPKTCWKCGLNFYNGESPGKDS
jgi:hypothetical protein